MFFRLRYITTYFDFGDVEIRASDPSKGIEVVYTKRLKDDEPPPLEPNDGLIVTTCERALSDRLTAEAAATGMLSFKKDDVHTAYEDMHNCMDRVLRLVRWRTNARGGPDPLRMCGKDYFTWSANGSDWKMVSDAVFAKLVIGQIDRFCSQADIEFVQQAVKGDINEPLAHELLREANVNQTLNRRSSLVLAVAAAEVGFKQFASQTLPDSGWLLELPSPPLVEMVRRFPWGRIKLRIDGKIPSVPEEITAELKKAVTLRNQIVHSGAANLEADTLESIVDTVRDFLYFLDMLTGSGQPWASNLIRRETVSLLKKG